MGRARADGYPGGCPPGCHRERVPRLRDPSRRHARVLGQVLGRAIGCAAGALHRGHCRVFALVWASPRRLHHLLGQQRQRSVGRPRLADRQPALGPGDLRVGAGDRRRQLLRRDGGVRALGARLRHGRHWGRQWHGDESRRFGFPVSGDRAASRAGHGGGASTPRCGPRPPRCPQRRFAADDDNRHNGRIRADSGDRHVGPRRRARGLRRRSSAVSNPMPASPAMSTTAQPARRANPSATASCSA